jgi:hypothetical protein
MMDRALRFLFGLAMALILLWDWIAERYSR